MFHEQSLLRSGVLPACLILSLLASLGTIPAVAAPDGPTFRSVLPSATELQFFARDGRLVASTSGDQRVRPLRASQVQETAETQSPQESSAGSQPVLRFPDARLGQLLWNFPEAGSQPKDGDARLLSRLWWQQDPLGLAGASSGSYLGIGVADVTRQMAAKLNLSEVRGVVVTAVAEGSPAQKAGLKVKDVLISYNGMRLEGRQQLTRMVAETPAERTVTLSILRNGSPQEIPITTAARRMNPELRMLKNPLPGRNMFILPDLPRMVSIYRSPMLGIESEVLNPQLATYFGVKEGVLIREVVPGSPAAEAGLKAGDVVVDFAGEAVSNPADISSILRAKGSQGDALSMSVVRNQKKVQLSISPSGEWTEGSYFKDDPAASWSRK